MKLKNACLKIQAGLRPPTMFSAPSPQNLSDLAARCGVSRTQGRPCNGTPPALLALGAGLACTLLTGSIFQVNAQTTNVIPPSYAYSLDTVDISSRGFVGKVHIARANQSFNASIGRANAQLRGDLIDSSVIPPAPYVNLVQTPDSPAPDNPNPVEMDGTYVNPGVINYSISPTPPNGILDGGLFSSVNGYTDARYPGLPGWRDATFSVANSVNAFAWEETAWLELRQGLITIGVHATDAVQIAIHGNDPRDIFRKPLVWFDSNGGLQTRTTVLDVQEAGVYGFRIVHTVFGSPSSHIEFFTADPESETLRTLVNDPADAHAIVAYQSLTETSRPYVDAVSPAIASSGVAVDAPIQVTFVNLGGYEPVLKVNDSPVVFTTSTDGNKTTITYTNPGGWGPARLVNVSVEYAGAVGSWSFQTETGLKALVVGLSAGDTLVAQRLATQFGLDVDNFAESTVSANTASNPDAEAGIDYLMKYALIWNSEAVSSLAARPYINFVRDNALPIPAINVEQGNVADWRLASGGVGPGGANFSSIIITDPTSPFAACHSGTVRILKDGAPNGTWHSANSVPTYAFGSLGTALNRTTPAVYGVLEETEAGAYVFPARRLQLGIAGPGMVAGWNDNGWAVFDAAVRWALNRTEEPLKFNPVVFTGTDVTISWTGTGVLEESSVVTGPWTRAASQANPQVIPATGTKIFRLRCGGE